MTKIAWPCRCGFSTFWVVGWADQNARRAARQRCIIFAAVDNECAAKAVAIVTKRSDGTLQRVFKGRPPPACQPSMRLTFSLE